MRRAPRGTPQANGPPGIMVVDLGDVVLPANSTAILDVIYTGAVLRIGSGTSLQNENCLPTFSAHAQLIRFTA